MKEHLLAQFEGHSAVIAVIGLGYVGLPLAVAFAERGFPVVGIDVDAAKVASLNQGQSYVQDIPSKRLEGIMVKGEGHNPQPSALNLPAAGRFAATTDYRILAQCDAAIICVPTPLNKTRDPDVRYIISSGESLAQHIHRGMLVVLESTTYPGTTEELLRPMLERSGLRVGEDIFLAFSLAP